MNAAVTPLFLHGGQDAEWPVEVLGHDTRGHLNGQERRGESHSHSQPLSLCCAVTGIVHV